MRSLNTKAGRLAAQQYQFDNLAASGYTRETYGDLNIFTKTDDVSTWLKIYRGTAAKEIVFKRYRTEAQAVEAIKNAKASHDRNKAYKAELKANPSKSSHANCAKAIREELKSTFPGVKFSVKSQSFSMGDSVHISWIDGPTSDQVREITGKYQQGSFNGMEDIYEYTNSREDLPQTKYVQECREISDEVNKVVKEAVSKLFNFSNLTEWEQEREINAYTYKIIKNNAIPVGATVTGIAEMEQGIFFEDRHPLTFDQPGQEEPKQEPNFEAVEVPAGEVQLIDYSDKAFAVIGDTKPIKDKLKELGGRWNGRLTCGAGWIFPKTKLSQVQAIFN